MVRGPDGAFIELAMQRLGTTLALAQFPVGISAALHTQHTFPAGLWCSGHSHSMPGLLTTVTLPVANLDPSNP